MNHFIKHITLGAVLGLAMLVGGTGQAHALLLNEDIRTDFLAPNTSTIQFSDVETVVAGVEYADFAGLGRVMIDFSDNLIKLTALVDYTFASLPFNGLRFLDENGTIPSWIASVNAGMTTAGLLGNFALSHTDNEILLNIQGLSVTAGDMIALNVNSQPVPEPSTMLLLGTGLAGVIAWRKRSLNA
jgi:PEP-CTERM motif